MRPKGLVGLRWYLDIPVVTYVFIPLVVLDTTGTPPISTVTPPPDDAFDDPRCGNGNNEYWPNVECTTYIECYAGHGHIRDCPSGLYFDEDTKKCVDPSQTTCGRSG